MSKDGKLTLIRGTLASVPAYSMSIHTIPISVAKRLEKLQSDFLWGGVGEEFKYHLCGLGHNLQPSLRRGFEVTRLGIFNKTLLGKRLWRFANEFWRRVTATKYGDNLGDCVNPKVPWSHGSGWYGRELSRSLKFCGGLNVQRHWCGGETLVHALFQLTVNREESVANYIHCREGGVFWDILLQEVPSRLRGGSVWRNVGPVIWPMGFSEGEGRMVSFGGAKEMPYLMLHLSIGCLEEVQGLVLLEEYLVYRGTYKSCHRCPNSNSQESTQDSQSHQKIEVR